jgi:hypothetical protein
MKLVTFALPAILLVFTQTTALHAQPTCDKIDAAISATEDFAEVVNGKDVVQTKRALNAIQTNFNSIKSSVNPATKAQITELINSVKSSYANGDKSAAAVTALDIYRLLIGVFEKRIPTTRSVAMLDYSGFRLHGLASAQSVNWTAISATVSESGKNWTSIHKTLKDKGLADLGDNIQAGLEDASKARDLGWLNSTAQIQLDSVDLLERVIKNKTKGACR